MRNLKRMVAAILTVAMLAAMLTGCQKKENQTEPVDPAALAVTYTEAITGARSREFNDYFPVVTDNENGVNDYVFTMLGVEETDLAAYAISMSGMNVNAYAVAAIMPAEEKADTVKDGLQAYIENQKQSFEHYLEDQFAIANSAKLETLKDGTILLVMCKGQDAVLKYMKEKIMSD